MALTDYLKLRGHTYYVWVQIPPSLWAAAGGRREYVKTLKTGDLAQANRLKHARIAVFQRRIKALERLEEPDPLADLYEKALSWRSAMEGARERVIIEDAEGRRAFDSREERFDVLAHVMIARRFPECIRLSLVMIERDIRDLREVTRRRVW